VNGRLFTAAEDWILRAYFPHVLTRVVADRLCRSYESITNRAHILNLHKTSEFMERTLRDCGKQATVAGAATRFQKGIVPANKGKRMPGWGPGRMKETQFKKGQVSINTMPLWSFRYVDGYLMLKIGKHHAPPNDGWEYIHKLVWEQANGPLPHWTVARVWWKDGDHANCSLSNLELVKGRDHVARTTIHNLPSSLKEVILLKGALKRRIGRMEKQNAEEHDGRSAQSPVCDDRSIAG
jgi:hypothetical protein